MSKDNKTPYEIIDDCLRDVQGTFVSDDKFDKRAIGKEEAEALDHLKKARDLLK